MTSPQKKVLIRKSVETIGPSMPENPKESPAPEKTEGDWKLSWTPEEMAQKKLIASGATQGKEYTSVNKKLTPLTPEEQKEGKVNLNKMGEEDKTYYLRKVLSYKGEVPTNEALEKIDSLAIIADKSGVTTPAQIKSLFENEEFKVKRLKDAGLTEEQFDRLGGKDKQDLYYSVLQQVNAKRKKLDPLKVTESFFVVDKPEIIKSPESEEVIENKIDSAVKLIKDGKGKVRQEMKDIK
jgi:hypothetical protein